MTMHRVKNLISILLDSPIYLTLSLKERHSLLLTMARTYPSVVDMESAETEVGYEASWAGIARIP